MIRYAPATTDAHLRAILELQLRNLPERVAPHRHGSDGFVTARHTLELLQRMNHPHPHLIALDADRVVGYALVMTRKWRTELAVLIPMFEHIDRAVWDAQPMRDHNYVVMGQICIAQTHRGQGIFRGLYDELCRQLQPHFDYLVTMILRRNERSVRAHRAVGFRELTHYGGPDDREHSIVLLPL